MIEITNLLRLSILVFRVDLIYSVSDSHGIKLRRIMLVELKRMKHVDIGERCAPIP